MKTSTIRWGVIGCGQIAVDKSLPGLLAAQSAELVAVSDPLEARRDLALQLASSQDLTPRAYGDYLELLADPGVEAVYISLPTGMHAEAVTAAARAKKAILCEKPLGRDANEVAGMVRAAQENDVRLMTAYMSRFSDVFAETARLLREKAIGQVTFVSAHFSYPCLKYYPPGAAGGWRWTDARGGGPLLDIGVYLAFALRELLDEPIARVAPLGCNTIAPPESAVFDTSVAWFQTRSGIPGTFVAAFSHFEVQITFHGTEGKLTLRDAFNQTPGGRVECQTEAGTHVFDTKNQPDLPHFDNYRREFEHFSRALLDQTPHQPSGADVLSDALLLDALQGAGGGGVQIPSAEEFL